MTEVQTKSDNVKTKGAGTKKGIAGFSLDKQSLKIGQVDPVTREPINSMRAPKAINFLKNNITENIISKINKLADGIGCLSEIPRNPLNIGRYAILETNLKA